MMMEWLTQRKTGKEEGATDRRTDGRHSAPDRETIERAERRSNRRYPHSLSAAATIYYKRPANETSGKTAGIDHAHKCEGGELLRGDHFKDELNKYPGGTIGYQWMALVQPKV